MVRVIIYVLVSIFLAICSKVSAQNNKESFCDTKEYTQFDFWVGNWKVYNEEGTLLGTNKVIKTTNACAIQENWESKNSDSKGTSYNYFNNRDNSWNQIWIDNKGESLVLKGEFKNGVMTLKSDLIKGEKGNYRNKITWVYQENGSVIQEWVRIGENGKETKKLFKGIYKK
ncbi:hypothetical protein SAMN04489761_2053 [Tenacibaculum sp. MAR_2009_124]|uniref:hypothetical protein n=1 Tax=Tenacibaculum sp. MAR_2009_124 TaxID=1250059 RepID=UPI00089B4451|nr:hypothetical protein [Tenacibaculum sp. MAR_2009_124]SEB94424.1 hypothetical protein SAMN04489761_2053 [Tenacibaculum sp. MAR_2009_124]